MVSVVDPNESDDTSITIDRVRSCENVLPLLPSITLDHFVVCSDC